MLRKRLNLKEKLGSSVKKAEKVSEDASDHEELLIKVETTDSASLQSSWSEGEKEVFELQLEQLEEQLTASWVKNQELGKFVHGRTTRHTVSDQKRAPGAN
jgi:hypothetical protein